MDSKKRAQINVTEYTDLKNRTHKVIHSIACSECDLKELEERISEDLYNIFRK